MNTILILEDDKIQQKYLTKTAYKINPLLNIITTDSTNTAFELSMNNRVDAFFIDIKLIDGNGISFAKKIREYKEYMFTPIIFITAIPSKLVEAFNETNCYEYLIKPYSEDKLIKIMKKILIYYLNNNPQEVKINRLRLNYNGIIQSINLSDILYIEYRLRKLFIITFYEEIEYRRIPLKKFINELNHDFIQVHQSFIINKNYINTINVKENIIILKSNNFIIPIGSSFRTKVLDILNNC